MKRIKVEAYGKTYNCALLVTAYLNNQNMAIELVDENDEPYATLTVNLDCVAPKYAYINVNAIADAESILKEHGIAEPTGTVADSGFVSYPLYKFNLDTLKQYALPYSDYFLLGKRTPAR